MKSKECPICKSSFESSHSRQVYCHDCLAFPKSGKAVIYALCESGNQEIRYIGSTTNPVGRFMAHRRNAHGPELKRWVESIDRDFEMIILEIVPKNQATISEQSHIYHYQNVGHRLLNKRAAIQKMFSKQEAHDFISKWFASH